MRFEVPQFIEVEDKIFGPLTWRQFLYLGGGIGMAVVIFITLPWYVFMILGLPLALLSGALAFYPVNNRPFSYFLEAIYGYVTGKHLYLWRKGGDTVYRESAPDATTGSSVVGSQSFSRNKKADITSLARELELQAMQKAE